MSRQRLSIAMAVAGAVLAVAGGIGLYMRAEVFNADAFGDHSVEALRQPEVREALTDPIVQRAIDSGPDELVNATPLLRSVVSGVLDSASFQKLFRNSAVRLYRSVFDGDPGEAALTISDLNVVVAEAARSVSPEVGRQIPRDLGDKLVEVTDSDAVLTSVQISEDVRVLGIILPLLAVLLLAGSVAISTDRRHTVLVASSSTAVTAALGLIALLIARSLVVSQFDNETVHLAVEALWDAFMGGLRNWLLFGGAFAVIVTAAAARAREVDATAPARRVLAAVAHTPAPPGLRLLRAAGIAGGSMLLLVRPDLALQVVTVTVGAYGLFYSSCEALTLLAPAAEERRRRRKAGERWPSRRAMIATAVLVAAGIGGALLAFGGDDAAGPRELGRPSGEVTHCNGHAELCDRPLDDVAFPSTHNSMSAAELPGWYTPNQRYGIQRQLAAGIRGFLIDTHYGIARPTGPVLTDLDKADKSKVAEEATQELGPEGARRFLDLHERYANRGGAGTPGVYLCHAVCELGATKLTTALGWFKDFLATHPDEVVILFIEDAVSPEDTATAFSESGILHYAYEHEPGQPFPTLRELIDADKRLFVMAERKSGGGEFPWYHQGFDLTQETPYTFDSPAELADTATSCAPNRGAESNPLFQLNHWVEKIPRSPSTARQVNAFDFLYDRARACQELRGLVPNIVGVDFYDEGDVAEVTRALNGIPRDERPVYRQTG
jgi:hypothetical protein